MQQNKPNTLPLPENWGEGCPIYQVRAVEGINSTSPLITNSAFLHSPARFFHSSESHSYKLFPPQKFSSSLPSIRETCHTHSCSSPGPWVLIFSEAEVVRTAWKLSNLNLISPAWIPKSVCFVWGTGKGRRWCCFIYQRIYIWFK